MAKSKGEAVQDSEPKVFNKEGEDYPGWTKAESEFGGGMSAAEKRLENSRCRIPYNTGAAREASGGTNTSVGATNVISAPGAKLPEASPTARRQSRDR